MGTTDTAPPEAPVGDVPMVGGTLLLRLPNQRPLSLLYVSAPETIYLIPTVSRTRWSSEIVRRGTADVTLPGGENRTVAVDLVVAVDEADRALRGFRLAHGEHAWERYFAGRPKVIALRPGNEGPPRTSEDLLRREFDAVAPRYTSAVQSDPVDAYLRERSTSALIRLFDGRDPLLEIGCGTGNETLPLLAAGHHVTAVDLSPEMLREIRGRANRAGVGERLLTIEGRLRDLGKVLESTSPGSFEGAYSTFGAFNLEPDLSGMGPALHRQLAPNAPLFLATLNPHAVMPLVIAVASGKLYELRARLSDPIPASGSRFPLEVYPLGVREVVKLLTPGFRLEQARAGSVLAPPDDLPRIRRRIGPRGFVAFRAWDARLSGTRIGCELAEWQFITLRRSPA